MGRSCLYFACSSLGIKRHRTKLTDLLITFLTHSTRYKNRKGRRRFGLIPGRIPVPSIWYMGGVSSSGTQGFDYLHRFA